MIVSLDKNILEFCCQVLIVRKGRLHKMQLNVELNENLWFVAEETMNLHSASKFV